MKSPMIEIIKALQQLDLSEKINVLESILQTYKNEQKAQQSFTGVMQK